MASSRDLAAYILGKHGRMTAMKLQKLCYYSQAYSLAWSGKPIFEEPIQAWTNGPIIPTLWQEHKGQFMVEKIKGKPENLTSEDQGVVNAVLDALGGLSGKQLSDRTHDEDPWKQRYDGNDAFPNGEITKDDLRNFYRHQPK